jgi:aromatic ring hydroxylase
MPARSGAEYVESLRKRAPCVYLGGRRVDDVTAEPVFQEPIRAVAEQYDMQLDPAYREVMTYPSPTTGHPVSTSFLVPYTREELVKKRKHFKLRADHNFGFMGRSPDFMNQFVTGWHLMADRFARAGARFGENATDTTSRRGSTTSSSPTC